MFLSYAFLSNWAFYILSEVNFLEKDWRSFLQAGMFSLILGETFFSNTFFETRPYCCASRSLPAKIGSASDQQADPRLERPPFTLCYVSFLVSWQTNADWGGGGGGGRVKMLSTECSHVVSSKLVFFVLFSYFCFPPLATRGTSFRFQAYAQHPLVPLDSSNHQTYTLLSASNRQTYTVLSVYSSVRSLWTCPGIKLDCLPAFLLFLVMLCGFSNACAGRRQVDFSS